MEFVNGRQEGFWGLLSLLREIQTGEWSRKHLFYDQSPKVAEMRARYAYELQRCLDESFEQCSEADVLKLVRFNLPRSTPLISHAGFHSATFVDLVSSAADQAVSLLTIPNVSKASIDYEAGRLFALDIAYLTAGVANELRIIRSGLADAEPPLNDSKQHPLTPDDLPSPANEEWESRWKTVRGWWEAAAHECGDIRLDILQYRTPRPRLTDERSGPFEWNEVETVRDFTRGSVEWSDYKTGTTRIHLRSAIRPRYQSWERHYVLWSEHGLTSAFRAAFGNTSKMLQSLCGPRNELWDLLSRLVVKHVPDAVLDCSADAEVAIGRIVDVALLLDVEQQQAIPVGPKSNHFETDSEVESQIMQHFGPLLFTPMVQSALGVLQRRIPHGILMDLSPVGTVAIMSPMNDLDPLPMHPVDHSRSQTSKATETASSGEKPRKKRRKQEWKKHHPPQDWYQEPIEAKLSELATIVGVDEETMSKNNGNSYWIWKVEGRKFRLYARHVRDFSRWNEKFKKLKPDENR